MRLYSYCTMSVKGSELRIEFNHGMLTPQG